MLHKHRAPESPADARMVEILAAVREVFAEKGFDGASMQDLAKAAKMSAGNFYRYFSSKEAIIEAMVRRDLNDIETYFAQIRSSDDPLATLRAALEEQLDECDCDASAIWCETIAASRRREEIGRIHDQFEATITRYLSQALAQIAGVAGDRAESLFRPHSTAIFLIVQGVKMRRRPDDGFAGSELRRLTMQSLDTLLAEVRRLRDTAASPTSPASNAPADATASAAE